jgi:hypothetical protein
MKMSLVHLTGLALLLAFAAFPASAQTPVNSSVNSIDARLAAIEQRLGLLEKEVGIQTPGPSADVGERLEALDQQIRIVGRQRELDQDAATAKAASAATVDASRDGFTIRSSRSIPARSYSVGSDRSSRARYIKTSTSES